MASTFAFIDEASCRACRNAIWLANPGSIATRMDFTLFSMVNLLRLQPVHSSWP